MNLDVVQEPLAFILPKRDTVSLDDQVLVPELTAPALQLPAAEPSLATPTVACPEAGPVEEPSELPQEPAEAGTGDGEPQAAPPSVDLC